MGALLAVEEIINDLSDRRGLDHEWGSIDDEIQSEIMEGWRVIIDARIAAAVAAEREACAELVDRVLFPYGGGPSSLGMAIRARGTP